MVPASGLVSGRALCWGGSDTQLKEAGEVIWVFVLASIAPVEQQPILVQSPGETAPDLSSSQEPPMNNHFIVSLLGFFAAFCVHWRCRADMQLSCEHLFLPVTDGLNPFPES